jgi:hypothetical protein
MMGRRSLTPRNIRQQRLLQKAGSANKHVRYVGIAPASFDAPATIGKAGSDNLLVEADEFGQATVASDRLDIRPDLSGRRVFARPIVVRVERKLVLARQDIDKETGKGVVPPSPANLARLFIDGEIDVGAFQHLRHEQA